MKTSIANLRAWVTLLLLASCFSSVNAQEYAKGKISRNVYRIPYANSMALKQGANDYVNHGGSMDSVAEDKVCTMAAATPCSTNANCSSVGGTCDGGYCTKSCTSNGQCAPGGGICDYVLVAPADGIVCQIIEHYNDCGCHSAYGPFGNSVAILHANGEMTRFLHVQQRSASLFGITPGMVVEQGQPVALEGAVGRTCGSSSAATTGSCLSEAAVPPKACENSFPFIACESNADCPGEDEECRSTGCGRHIHWNIMRFATGEVVNPFTCGIPGNIHTRNSSVQAPCGDVPATYANNATLSPAALSGFGTFRVLQAHSTISAGTADVSNQASLVLHAGSKVTLQPGFRVHSDGYFRAEIAAPDLTAPSQRPIPNTCPCNSAAGFCYQWSDPASPDGVTQGCATPGPEASKCHGCPEGMGGSGGQRCCQCLATDDCQP